MSQSAPAEPIVTSSDKMLGPLDGHAEPSPPLGKLVAAIREYVIAVRLGEDAGRRRELSERVVGLCLCCRPKHHEHEMRCSDGITAHVVWTYSTIIVQLKDPDGRAIGAHSKGRPQADMPSELDRELDRVRDEMARAEYETTYG